MVITLGQDAFKTLVNIFDSIIDTVMDKLAPLVSDSPQKTVALAVGMFALNLAVYAVCGFVFFGITRKNIRKESERQVKEKDLIYAAIAHDLKTPMTSVQGFARALSEGRIPPGEQQEIFDIIYRKSDTMNEMVNTLFDYAKLGTEDYKPELSEVDICSLVREIIADAYCDLEGHDIVPEVDIPEDEITVKADRNGLKRAVMNLVVNIYRHNPDGIKAKVSVSAEKGRAVIRIADSGVPLPENTDFFEPFITENTARTAGQGTGLGLAVTKRVIERHGGEVSAESALPDYTKMFVIRLQTVIPQKENR